MSKNLPLTNYNIFYLQGDDTVDDMDVVETLGLDPQVAYTPNINTAAIEKMRKANLEDYLKSGIPEDKAKSMANFHATAAKAAVETAMREQKKQFAS